MEEIHGNAGGPVFPQNVDLGCGQGITAFGMSVRQYFAAHAPVGWMDAADAVYRDSDYKTTPVTAEIMAALIKMRADYADQMLAALGAEQTPLQRAAAAGEDTTGLGTIREAVEMMLACPMAKMEMVVPLDGQRFNIEIRITQVIHL